MYPACSERVPLRLLVRDERRFGVSGSEVPLLHRHWLGQLDLPPSHPRLVRGPQHRPGRTTTRVACPATILCIVGDLSCLPPALQTWASSDRSEVLRRAQCREPLP